MSEYGVQLELRRYAAHNSCMKLHISEPFFTSDSFFWKLARILLIAVPPLIGFGALADSFPPLIKETAKMIGGFCRRGRPAAPGCAYRKIKSGHIGGAAHRGRDGRIIRPVVSAARDIGASLFSDR